MSDTILETRAATPQQPPPRARLSLVSLAVSLGLVALVLGYVGGPAVWQWDTASQRHGVIANNVVEQASNISTPVSDPGLTAQLRTAPTSTQGAPIIVTYHNIAYDPSPQTVTPEAFAAQMQLLHDAGWSTGTARQLDDWLAGRPWPAHTVMVTFDDGARGVWEYADAILARNSQHATAYIITGFVGTHAPYYMTWPEITHLYATGRWDIEAHTHLGHVQIPRDAAGNRSPYLTTLQYLPSQNRVETIDEYRNRIVNDLTECKRQIVSHGLPMPDFFAYPFSAHEGFPNGTNLLTNTVQSLFKASMLDEAGQVATTTTSILGSHDLARMDITGDVTTEAWVRRMIGSSPLDPINLHPFAQARNWTTNSGSPVTLQVRSDSVALDPGPGAYVLRRFAPAQTNLWRNYSVRATLGGLGSAGSGATTGLIVLSDDPQQVEVTVTAASYDIIQGSGHNEKHLTGVLPGNGPYTVEVEVRPGLVTVMIDGRTVGQMPLHAQELTAPGGGIAISANRSDARSPVPQISNLALL